MAVENVNSKPIAASAEIADFILASIGGKLRRVPIRTLAETLTDAEVELISAAASALVSAAGRASYIGDNGNWYVWDGTKGMFVDSGKSSRGQQGVPGATPNLQIGTVETLPAGSDATASMGGTVENPLLNLGIPKGADGSGSGVAGDYLSTANPRGTGSIGMNPKANTTLGENAVAMGQETAATKAGAVALGYKSEATASGAVALGRESKASGDYAVAAGHSVEASGGAAMAEGWVSQAKGQHSHAEGTWTIAHSKAQHVEGMYNVEDTTGNASSKGTYLHIAGNGESNSARSNAHTLDWSGNAWFAGDVYTGSTGGKNKDAGSKKLATEEYVDNHTGSSGKDGTTFTPSVSADGILSWTNDGGKENPASVNIKGPAGEAGAGSEPFYVGCGIHSEDTYDESVTHTKTYDEILAAYKAGKACYARVKLFGADNVNDIRILPLAVIDEALGYVEFALAKMTQGDTPEELMVYYVSIDSDGGAEGYWGTRYTLDSILQAFSGASASAAGKAGLVPAPTAGQQGKYLKGDGTWSDLPSASTGSKGITYLVDAVNRNDTDKAATAKAVNTVYKMFNRATSANEADTNYATLMVRGESLNASAVTPEVNGAIAWQYA